MGDAGPVLAGSDGLSSVNRVSGLDFLQGRYRAEADMNSKIERANVAIFDVIDIVGHAVEGMAVWRYLFSPTYRSSVHARWRDQSIFDTAMDIFGYGLSFIFVNCIVWGLGWLVVSGT